MESDADIVRVVEIETGEKIRGQAKESAQTARIKSRGFKSQICSNIATHYPFRLSCTVVVSRLFIIFLALAGCALVRAADGDAIFSNHCASCHGPDGKGRTPAGKKIGAKDLSESRVSDDAIAHQIAEGVKDKKGAERMPSFKSKLTPDEIAALVSFVKAFRR
jgi:cytochrome c551/c552